MSITSFPLPEGLRLTRLLLPMVSAALCSALAALGSAQVFDERFDDWPVDLKINGRLVLTAEAADLRWLDGNLPAVVASGDCLLVHSDDEDGPVYRQYAAQFADLATCSADQLAASLARLDPQIVAWHVESWPTAPPSKGQSIAAILNQQLTFGKTVIVSGPGAGHAGKFGGSPGESAAAQAGYHLFPDCIFQLDFDPSQAFQLVRSAASAPRCVAIGLEPHTVLILDGRKLSMAGLGRVWLGLPRGAGLPSRLETIEARTYHNRDIPTRWLADLTQWRRDAIDRTLEPFPAARLRPPQLEQGTLVMVGGGGMPAGLMQQFVLFAGGAQKARLVYVPCAEEEHVEARSAIIDDWLELGVHRVSTLHTKDRLRANSDEAFLAPLREATGIWFGGGRQWNLADSYYGTEAHRLMKLVLRRGGVIGGSSAGASIQARYLARATPIENVRLMAPGYERGGLGFISGVAIDQHFSQRGRQPDMEQLVMRYPQLLGVGIDEATALIVRGSRAEIAGRGQVFFYEHRAPGEIDVIQLGAGKVYDLTQRRIVNPSP